MGKMVGVDLGTANTLMFLKGKGIVLRAPSVVAISRADREVVALGREAQRMLGRTPEGILAFRPIKDGVIADFDVAAKMLRAYFEITGSISLFSRPTVVVCIPYGVTDVEKRAVEDVTYQAGARSVALVDEPLAAALGAELRVGRARGSMIVDIGGGTTEVAVISMGGIVASQSLRIAGDEFDEAIVEYLKKYRDILVGNATAEELKLRIGAAHPTCLRGNMEVSGRSLRTGLGVTATVQSDEIREALERPLMAVIRTIKSTLEQTPPELSADIFDFGITLTGGGALLRGIDRLIMEKTGLRVNIAKDPLECVCKGIGRIIESDGSLGDLLQIRQR